MKKRAVDTKPKNNRYNLAQVNFVLVCLILACNLYVLILPIIPTIILRNNRHKLKAVACIPYKTYTDTKSSANTIRKDIPSDSRLVIPSLGLDEHIYEGSSPYLVNKGVWARPKGSTPPKGGNTVLVGHRFTYNGPATFYSLDKVAVNDKILIYWGGEEYDYTVRESKVVAATAVDIESATKTPRLTIYTCTPLWSAKDRLVLIATPSEAL